MKNKKMNHIPISPCTCCYLMYGYSDIMGGLTISLVNKKDPTIYEQIDIPEKELPHLLKAIKMRLEKK